MNMQNYGAAFLLAAEERADRHCTDNETSLAVSTATNLSLNSFDIHSHRTNVHPGEQYQWDMRQEPEIKTDMDATLPSKAVGVVQTAGMRNSASPFEALHLEPPPAIHPSLSKARHFAKIASNDTPKFTVGEAEARNPYGSIGLDKTIVTPERWPAQRREEHSDPTQEKDRTRGFKSILLPEWVSVGGGCDHSFPLPKLNVVIGSGSKEHDSLEDIEVQEGWEPIMPECLCSFEFSVQEDDLMELDLLFTDDDISCNLSPLLSLYHLQSLMKLSRRTQERLQEWDVQNGLPRSHSVTMVKTSRSRRQLELGKILPKWNGLPLIAVDGEEKKIRAPPRKRRKRTTALKRPPPPAPK